MKNNNREKEISGGSKMGMCLFVYKKKRKERTSSRERKEQGTERKPKFQFLALAIERLIR